MRYFFYSGSGPQLSRRQLGGRKKRRISPSCYTLWRSASHSSFRKGLKKPKFSYIFFSSSGTSISTKFVFRSRHLYFMALITAVWASSLSELIFRLHIFIRRLSTSLITVYCTTARTVSSSQTTASSPGSGTRAVPRVSNWYCSSYSSLEKDFAWTTFTYTVLFVSLNMCIYGSNICIGQPCFFIFSLIRRCLVLKALFSIATCSLYFMVRALLFSIRFESVLR